MFCGLSALKLQRFSFESFPQACVNKIVYNSDLRVDKFKKPCYFKHLRLVDIRNAPGE